jgi:uncharacterized membrane protein YbhN (UPF0104 family)
MHRLATTSAILAALAISAAFALVAIRNVEWEEFRAAIADCTWWWLLPAAAVLAVGVFLRAVRWWLLFPRALRPPLVATTRALLVGTFFNNVLPGRPGEAIRVVTLHQETQTSRAAALGTAVTERVYDVVVLLGLLFAAWAWLPEVAWLRRAAVFGAVVAVALIVLLLALARWEERPVVRALRPLGKLPALSPERMEHAARALVLGLAGVRRAGLAAPVLLASAAAVLTITLSFWLVMFAFHLGLPFGAAILVMVATNLAMLIPSSPAALGIFEAATVVALRPYGVDESHALSYAVVLHALNSLPFIAIGLVLVPRHGVRALRSAAGARRTAP